jgi:hypothetical protein
MASDRLPIASSLPHTAVMTLLLVLLFVALALALLSGDWRAGYLVTVIIGFAQDPIRKLTPNQPGLYVGLVLIAFLATTFVVWQQYRGSFDLALMFPTSPTLRRWLPVFVVFILIQSVNSLLRWGIPLRTLVGLGFYLAPLVALWVGFQVGRSRGLLQKILNVYIALTLLFAITALAHYMGVDIPVFKGVKGDSLISIRRGFSATGAIGLWRTTDIAAIHLAIASCFAFTLSMATPPGLKRYMYFALSAFFALTSILTGRRKAIVQVFVFLLIFTVLVFRYGSSRHRRQYLGVAIASAGLASFVFLFDPFSLLGPDFAEYVGRASTASGDLADRFETLGLRAFVKGLAASRFVGLGVGTLAQTGDSGITRIVGRGLEFVSESGIGKVTAELGLPGLLLIAVLAITLFRSILFTLSLVRYLPDPSLFLHLGLLAFALSNLPFFSSAAGVYGDPFVLILCGMSLGSIMAIPSLLEQMSHQRYSNQAIQPSYQISPR